MMKTTMKTIHSTILLFSLLGVTDVSAFLGPKPIASHPNLQDYAKAQLNTLLDIRFDLGSKAQDARMSLQGPIVKLADQVATSVRQKMSLANRPPRFGTETRSLDIVKNGFVVDMNGMRPIPFEQGSWEMHWVNGRQSGSIVCAFDLPEAISRNQASIPACRVFVNFDIWTAESLEEERAIKKESEESLLQLEKEKEHAKLQYMESSNPIVKAMHYHAALQAMEKIYNTPKRERVPMADHDVVPLADGLFLTKKGNVWTRPSSSGNPFDQKPTHLGFATVTLGQDTDEKPKVDDDDDNDKYKGLAP